MFSIIAGVLGAGIVIALLVVGFNYLGNAMDDSTEKSRYAAFQNTGNQIKAAVQFYITEHGSAPRGNGEQILRILEGENIVLDGETTGQNVFNQKYVKAIPRDQVAPAGTSQDWTISGKYAFTPLADVTQCKKMNKYANMIVDGVGAPAEGCPPCDGPQAAAFENYPACKNQ